MDTPEPPPDYAVEIEGLVKIYPARKNTPEKHALKGVDLKVRRGSIFGLRACLRQRI